MKTLEIADYNKILETNRVASQSELVEGVQNMYKGKTVLVETFEVVNGEVNLTKQEVGEGFDVELKMGKSGEHPVLSYDVNGESKSRHMLSKVFVYEKGDEDPSRESLVVCWKSEKTSKEMVRRFSLAS